jgi:hypothetical protein
MPSVKDLSLLHDLDLFLGQPVKLTIHFVTLPNSGCLFYERTFNRFIFLYALVLNKDALGCGHSVFRDLY